MKKSATARPKGGHIHVQPTERAMTLRSDPSGDFAPGMWLSVLEVAYGLRHDNWADGTTFDYGRQRLTVRAGVLQDGAGEHVSLHF